MHFLHLLLLIILGHIGSSTTVRLGNTTLFTTNLPPSHPLLFRLQQRTGWDIRPNGPSVLQHFDARRHSTTTIPSLTALRQFHRSLRISHSHQTAEWNRTRLHSTPPAPPRWPIRGNQISVAHHSSFFRTWPELSQFVVDLSIFGNNFIETAHINDTSSLLNSSSIVNISTLLHRLNTSCSFWWSNTLMDHHLAELNELFAQSPRIDSVFFPGGDGGALEWSTINETATLLRRSHPRAGVWVSAQEVNATVLAQFLHDILTNATIQNILGSNGGVVYGPHNRIPFSEFVHRLRPIDTSTIALNIRQYPDLAHSVDTQFAIQQWDAPLSESYQRQVVNPLPVLHASIVQARSNGSSPNIGVGAYSEGLNDDLNKFVWSAMGADATENNVHTIVQEYCQYFFGDDAAHAMYEGIMGLEQNWNGKVVNNQQRISTTLQTLKTGFGLLSQQEQDQNWRATMYLRRGFMDQYIYDLHSQDVELLGRATAVLSQADTDDANDCQSIVQSALAILAPSSLIQNASTDPLVASLRRQIVTLAADLDRQVGAEVLQTQDTALNMNSIDSQLYLSSTYLRSWLLNLTSTGSSTGPRSRASSSTTPTSVCTQIYNYLNWTNPGVGGYYDNIGSIDALDHPHLVRSVQGSSSSSSSSSRADPSCYDQHCVLQGGSNALKNIRPSWLRYGMVMFDNALTLRYTNVDTLAQYNWEVVMWYCWFDCSNDLVKFTVNGVPLTQKYIAAPNPMRKLSFSVPSEAFADTGTIEISCERVDGLGGNGKTCQLTEAWLRKV